jgi:protein-S-isoprenylcysteine O-methyltransferase Ste14
VSDAPVTQAHADRAGRTWFSRAWHSIPEWFFRLFGAAVFFSYAALQAWDYAERWPRLDYYYVLPGGRRLDLPYVRVLVDLTFVSIAWGYCVRGPPRRRARGPAEVLLPFLAAVWPMAPFVLARGLALLASFESGAWLQPAARAWSGLLGVGRISAAGYLLGCGLIGLGSLLDVWGYVALRRSLSIVAEARELCTAGPYRWVRHPIYLGQFIAQAGVWLVLRSHRGFGWGYYAAFVALQLYRCRVEERVLERAFGEPYREWRRRTIWLG